MSLDVSLTALVPTGVYNRNLTHNLTDMAKEAGIYKHVWRPEEIGITKAAQLVEPLVDALALLLKDRNRFERFNPPNGWGSYDGFVEFVEDYLRHCRLYPDADISVSR